MLGVTSALFSAQPSIGLQEVSLTILIALSCTLIATHCRQSSQHNHWLLVLALLPLIPSIQLIAELTIHFPVRAWNYSFDNIRMYGDATLPLVFLAMSVFERRRQHLLALLLPALYLFGLLLDNGRANILGYCVGLALLHTLSAPKMTRLAWRILILALTSYLITQATLGDGVSKSLIRTGSSQRVEIYLFSFNNWLDHLWLGIGPGTFNHVADEILVSHPHNIVWQWLYEWGLIGGLLLSAACLRLLHTLWRHRLELDAAMLAALAAFSINSLLSGAMIYPVSQMILIALIASVFSRLPAPISNGPLQAPIFALAIFVIIATQHSNIIEIITNSEWISQPNGPRFWAHGEYL